MGAVEYGVQNSKILITLHFIYYLSCFFEGCFKQPFVNNTLTILSLLVYVFSIIVLYYVIFQLKQVWTVKLIIGQNTYHRVNTSFLFRYVRHPNYYLNIIPELIAISFLFRAWYTCALGLPLYLFFLINRIKQEEVLMSQHFNVY